MIWHLPTEIIIEASSAPEAEIFLREALTSHKHFAVVGYYRLAPTVAAKHERDEVKES